MKNNILFLSILCLLVGLLPACEQQEDALTTADQPSVSSETDATDDDDELTSRSSVVLPAGSHNALAAALAGHQTVVLASGVHTESERVVVSGNHNIIGQAGAVLKIAGTPGTFENGLLIDPGLHFLEADGSKLKNIQLLPYDAEALPGTAILVELSDNVKVENCQFINFQNAIILYDSDDAKVQNNHIVGHPGWLTGDLVTAIGVLSMKGDDASIKGNEISNTVFGAWCSGTDGDLRNNDSHNNAIGIIVCKVLSTVTLPNGEQIGFQDPTSGWTVRNNASTANFDAGIMVVWGATDTQVIDNDSHGNSLAPYYGTAADIEIMGPTTMFGFPILLPADGTYVDSESYPGTTIRDCGDNSTVLGGTPAGGACR